MLIILSLLNAGYHTFGSGDVVNMWAAVVFAIASLFLD